MKQQLTLLVKTALDQLVAEQRLTATIVNATAVRIEHTKDSAHGDFSTNIAMMLAKPAQQSPRTLATWIVAALPAATDVAKVDIAGPGFINFHITADAYYAIIPTILDQGPAFGRSHLGTGHSVQVEFVSANPTGPLHVGHGRGAAYGAVVANLLAAIGYQVHREYYVNDAGRQMDILATSVWLRYLELCGETFVFPSNAYQGDYVWDIAATLHREQGDHYHACAQQIITALATPLTPTINLETYMDQLIALAKQELGDHRYRLIFELGLNVILDDIREDLNQFGIDYQQWYSERTLVERGAVNQIISRLRQAGYTYEQQGALWFKATAFGDDKDRVLIRDNGQTTYFATDIAYHADKLERGFSRIIDIWGADHHGYVPRIKAALQALGDDPQYLDVLLVQFAVLYRGGEKIQMSTRSGEFVTLRELRREVGCDAARFFYIMRRCEQHLDFDLDLAKSHSTDNPVYYVQYAHARIAGVLRQAAEKGITIATNDQGSDFTQLSTTHELALLKTLARYPELITTAAQQAEPHLLTQYLRDLATDFHAYYNAYPFLVAESVIRDARLKLILATRQVLRNGLELIGVSAPETM
jgi:arginyl-tRNA synthetase